MAITAVRPETGAVIRPGPMVTVPPSREVGEDHYAEFARDTGLNGPFVADQLSAFVAHERMGVNLLRVLRARTDDAALGVRYGNLERATLHAVEAWERLIESLGGNPRYVSPAGRATEALDDKAIEALLLSGSADPTVFQQVGMRAFAAAVTQRSLNVRLLAAFAREADEGASRTLFESAVRDLEPAVHSDIAWVTQELEKAAVTQAKHPFAGKIAQAAERASAKVRSAFGH